MQEILMPYSKNLNIMQELTLGNLLFPKQAKL